MVYYSYSQVGLLLKKLCAILFDECCSNVRKLSFMHDDREYIVLQHCCVHRQMCRVV